MNQKLLGSALRAAAEALEANERLDKPARVLERIAGRVTRDPRRRDFLLGQWLGHSFHPMVTDFPLGAWMCVSLLDLAGGEQARPAARKLLVFGVAMAIPTAAAGLAEWSRTEGGPRRVGVVHASVNSTALSLYSLSLVARLRGRHTLGVVLGIGGGVAATIGGYFGGHLSLARGVGVE